MRNGAIFQRVTRISPSPFSSSVLLLLAVTMAASQSSFAQSSGPASKDELRKRKESLQYILREQPVEQVSRGRYGCATGQMPQDVALRRRSGFEGIPDVADDCVTTLSRLSQEGLLSQYYQTALTEVNGRSDGAEKLPAAIAATVMRGGSNQVPIGNQKAMLVTAALAFDAGFSMAAQSGTKYAAGMPGLAALKPIAERCLSQAEKDLGLCYSSGYVYGARAASRLPVTE